MKNQLVAKIFFEIADLLEVQDVQWKPQAYRKAAMTIENMQEDVDDIYREGGLKALEDIPGVGKAIAAKTAEILETGTLCYYEKLKKEVPVEFDELTAIQGLGPKSVKKLYDSLGVKNMADLKKAVEAHKIRELDGFGEKSEQEIAHGIELIESSAGRMLLGYALPEARELVEQLKEPGLVKEIEIAGSLRRRKETIGDFDILVTSSEPDRVMEKFVSLPEVKEVVVSGPTKTTVLLKNGLNCDLRVLDPKCYGAALQYFTGSKEHNIAVRKIAISKGFKLSEYGLFKGKKLVAGRTEKGVYKKLGMQWMPPEMRENTGEVKLAQQGKLPKIIGYNDVRGDLHVHSNWSDGVSTMEEDVGEAEEMGYDFLCISDHIGDIEVANPVDEKRFPSYLEAIEKAADGSKLRVFKGAEVDIRKDGELAISKSMVKQLDVVVASVHRNFKMPEKEMTERLVKAIESGWVHIIGHPTGRLIGLRDAYSFDFDKVFEAAEQNDVALEINCFPERLDLSDVNSRRALEAGCDLSINTDAHNCTSLHSMELGVAQARRAWAPKTRVLNAFTLRKLENRVGW